MYCKYTPIPSPRRDIHIVQASRRAAKSRLITATKIIKMKLQTGHSEQVKGKTLRRRYWATAYIAPFQHVRPDFRGRHLEMRRVPGMLGDAAMRERWLLEPEHGNKTTCKNWGNFSWSLSSPQRYTEKCSLCGRA